MLTRALGILFLFAAVAQPLAAQTSYPMITHCTPMAVERGKEVVVVVEGQMSFANLKQVLLSGTGVTGTIIEEPAPVPTTPPKGKGPAPVRSCKVKFTVAPDAPLGVREFRLAGSQAISTLGQIIVCSEPVVLETADNNTIDKAQKVTLPTMACGRIEIAEDVDCYRITAKAKTHLTLEIICARAQDKIHDLQKHADPMVTLLDATGKEVAANDDAIFADSALTYTIPSDGDYMVQVRDAKYDGDPRWAYASKITDRAQVRQVFPLAGAPGKPLEIEPVGSAALFAPRGTINVPKTAGIHEVCAQVSGQETNPVGIVASELPLVNEQESNNTFATAQKLTYPVGVNGRIGEKRDLDYFSVKGVKGKAIKFTIYARRFGTLLNSQVDTMLDIVGPTGAVLGTNDDTNGKDAALVYTPTADGDVVVRVRDLNNKGGPGYVYFLEIDHALPDFTMKCDPSKTMIGPGANGAVYVSVARANGFTGPVKVEVDGLPPGVKASPLTIPSTMTQGLVVLMADEKTPPGASIYRITGTGEATIDSKQQIIKRTAVPIEEIYNPGGGRGAFPVGMQAVAVCPGTDILAIDVKPAAITLKPGEEIKLDITIKKHVDYDKDVSLDLILRHLGQSYGNPLPPGVTIVEGKSKTLLGKGTTGHITLKAATDAAPIDDVPISILANVSINFVVKVSYSSQPIRLSIKK